MESVRRNFQGDNNIFAIKVATILLGIVNIGFIGHSYYNFGTDKAYLSAVIICFIISFLWAVAIIVGLLQNTDQEQLKKMDMMYHMIACIFYLVTLICFFVSLIDHAKYKTYLWERIVSFLLGIGITILYGLGGYLFWRA